MGGGSGVAMHGRRAVKQATRMDLIVPVMLFKPRLTTKISSIPDMPDLHLHGNNRHNPSNLPVLSISNLYYRLLSLFSLPQPSIISDYLGPLLTPPLN